MEQKMATAFLKRVKRHVVGRRHLFFVNTSPGLSRLCLRELESLITGTGTARIVSGGVEFEGRLIDCFAANLHLRTANRILMRLTSFTSTNFRQLERNLSRLPWELYLYPGSRLKVSAATRHSRLFHTEALADRLRRSICDRWSAPEADSSPDGNPDIEQTVYIRAVDDRFTVSLDSSGEHLHKRGLKTYPGPAPLRETLAAAVLKWAGYRPERPLLDPMCGSGTFSMEAAFIAKKIPAGYFRYFAFMGWPGFRSGPWNYVKRTSEKNIQPMARAMIFASDKAPDLIRQVEKCTVQYGVSDAVKSFCMDFFSLSPKDIVDSVGLVVLNPPYGHRIGNAKESRLLYEAIYDKLAADFSGWECALILPDQKAKKAKFVGMKSFPIYHGGRKLHVLIGRIS